MVHVCVHAKSFQSCQQIVQDQISILIKNLHILRTNVCRRSGSKQIKSITLIQRKKKIVFLPAYHQMLLPMRILILNEQQFWHLYVFMKRGYILQTCEDISGEDIERQVSIQTHSSGIWSINGSKPTILQLAV